MLAVASDPLVARTKRLAIVAAVFLGVIWFLARGTAGMSPAPELALLLGWLLMPAVLVASLIDSRWRTALLVPSTLVTIGLILVTIHAIDAGTETLEAWVMITAGVVIGDLMGAWLWLRFVPVPRLLAIPESPARWLLIAIHVTLILSGILWLSASSIAH